ncbi:MAG: hypothetical protein GF317_16865 [Candidatus Lokiarchaeota archaeon]|nr:hypothetical protein [Candidatus Lokiarchaeota archaeon]MBD3201190.1 hypothetical protein [Candidatus Lokiarchaeota archaeon]
MNLKRLGIATLLGAILGILCIIGASGRVGGWFGNEILLIGLWYNRVIMGLLIGFAEPLDFIKRENILPWYNAIIRGIILGTLVSLQFFLSTVFLDLPTFLAGIAYGIIIDVLSTILVK